MNFFTSQAIMSFSDRTHLREFS